MSEPVQSSTADQGPEGAPRALLRLSHRLGRDASRSPNEGTRETVQRALSRGTGRAGHFLDARNPSGMARFGRGTWLAVAAGVALVAVGVVLSRRRGSTP
jgi:hypothetical protein